MNTTGSTRQFSQDDLRDYLAASHALESSRSRVEALEQTAAVETFNRQMELLRRRLLDEPRAFREMFIADGIAAVAAEFRQEALSGEFIRAFWEQLLRDDDMSVVLMRFVWSVPLGLKRKFVRALDEHLSERYPIFKGLSENWPMESHIPPYIRSPEERSADFGLVNQGYLGYMNLGLSRREVDLIVWLEVLRDKQCEERPCEVGQCVEGRPEPKGGCPVKIHIPEALDLLGKGRFREAMELIEGINPLPNVTGR
ncbi:MAG: 2-polyprenylphenol hydroxylase, partial [Candidatus Accumulibacter sp.]|nr:2-polyprenylphenol hydroxylase [Accumulibacter sp.]